MTHQPRVETANRVLATFAKETHIEIHRGGIYVCWSTHRGEKYSRRWMTRGQDFYPVWHRSWGHGGTASTALAQLVRWIRNQPVLPIATWRYWAGDKCRLIRDGDAAGILLAGGYPEHAHCVLCGLRLDGAFDWWSLDKVSGLCCGWNNGCRQNAAKKEDLAHANA